MKKDKLWKGWAVVTARGRLITDAMSQPEIYQSRCIARHLMTEGQRVVSVVVRVAVIR